MIYKLVTEGGAGLMSGPQLAQLVLAYHAAQCVDAVAGYRLLGRLRQAAVQMLAATTCRRCGAVGSVAPVAGGARCGACFAVVWDAAQ